ncbi:Uncharacterised protein [Mycobacteroides abscessus subsp. abscessus]|nr:Uncharacterised protein [Mycobacteroides abscessus subsp. abscessus]
MRLPPRLRAANAWLSPGGAVMIGFIASQIRAHRMTVPFDDLVARRRVIHTIAMRPVP